MYLRWSESQDQAVTLAPATSKSGKEIPLETALVMATVKANAGKLSMWATGYHYPHFTDDRSPVYHSQPACSLAPELMLRTTMTCTTSLEKQPEPHLLPKMFLTASLLRAKDS